MWSPHSADTLNTGLLFFTEEELIMTNNMANNKAQMHRLYN